MLDNVNMNTAKNASFNNNEQRSLKLQDGSSNTREPEDCVNLNERLDISSSTINMTAKSDHIHTAKDKHTNNALREELKKSPPCNQPNSPASSFGKPMLMLIDEQKIDIFVRQVEEGKISGIMIPENSKPDKNGYLTVYVSNDFMEKTRDGIINIADNRLK